MDARKALDAIYEYIKAKDSSDFLADYHDGEASPSKLDEIASKFADAVKG